MGVSKNCLHVLHKQLCTLLQEWTSWEEKMREVLYFKVAKLASTIISRGEVAQKSAKSGPSTKKPQLDYHLVNLVRIASSV